MTYELEDVEQLADEAPDTIHLPSALHRLTLQPGARAQVVVITPTGVERVWCEVVDVLDHLGYVGKLRTQPVITPLNLGDEIAFAAKNIVAIRTDR
jgi:hypothetical protein